MALFNFKKKKNEVEKKHEPQKAASHPTDEYLDDMTFIKEIGHTLYAGWHQYDVVFAARGYGWDTMIDWADYMAAADFVRIDEVWTGFVGLAADKDVTESYENSNRKCAETPELETERGFLSIAGTSKTLKAPMKIIWINQTNYLTLLTLVNNDLLIKKYVESVARRNFGTEDAMKLGRPIPHGQ